MSRLYPCVYCTEDGYSAVWVRPNGFCHWGERKDDEPE